MASESPSSTRRWRGVAIAATCTAAMIVNSSNNTSVAIALPSIGSSLHARSNVLQWFVSAYPLSSGCLLLVSGHLADNHGRKRVLVAGSAVLAAFTLGCGFATNGVTLAILRALQGIGGAATIPAAIGILAHEFPPSQPRARAAAFSSFSAGAPIGGALGMILGGLVTQLSKHTWRAQFWLSAALAFATLLAAILLPTTTVPTTYPPHSPAPAKTSRAATDWPGLFLSTAGLVLLVFVLGQGSDYMQGWGMPYIISLLVVSILLLVAFALWELHLESVHSRPGGLYHAACHYTPPPLLRPSLFSRAKGRVGAVYVVAFFQFAGFMIWAYWVQLYYQVYIGYSPVRTVVRLVPMFVTGILCNIVVALIVGKVSTGWLLATGTLCTTIAPLLFALIIPSAPYWAFGFPAAIFSVIGADFLFAAGTLFVSNAVGPDEQSLAGGVFQTMTQLGTSLGVTVSTIVLDNVTLHVLRNGDTLKAYQAANWTGVAFGVVGMLRSLRYIWFGAHAYG
ncbi:efflux transporter [Mycena amicta]|nr:efflux transporter [Mycena amicta]